MKSILITGGACAGKTTSLEMIKNYLSAKGYKVIVIDEVPTNLIKTGIAYEKIGKLEFIELIIKTQINNEKEIFEKYDNEKNTIVIFDGSPLQTIAKKYPELYSNDNNIARLPDINLAIERNDRLEKYYNKYRKISVIECENDINIKNNNIKKAIETL